MILQWQPKHKMAEDARASTFSLNKRLFLLSKLDEVIQLWARGVGQGSFYFTVNDGIPNLQTGLLVGLEDDPVSGSQHVPQKCHQEYQHQHVNQQKKNYFVWVKLFYVS